MKPYFADDAVTLYAGDCLDVLPTLPDATVDAIVCDPPYGLTELSTAKVLQAIAAWMSGDRTHVPDGRGFMGREWDQFVPPPGVWDECMRVLKPGGHLLAFSGARTVDLMTLSIRIAGFEIRESISWVYGSGMPKSLDVSKAIEKASGAPCGDARRWSGFGTSLKPAHEPIVCARKPLGGTVAATVLKHGTGALNIDGCRTGWDPKSLAKDSARRQQPRSDITGGRLVGGDSGRYQGVTASPAGRWPTNVVLTHPVDCADGCAPDCPVADMDAQSGVTRSSAGGSKQREMTSRGYKGGGLGQRKSTDHEIVDDVTKTGYAGEGGASRYFPVFRYEAKAAASERPRAADGTAHATVKPLALMRWLVRLVTQPGGLILDPFLGSGTTAEACVIEGFRCVGIERDKSHLPLIKARLSKPIQPTLGEAS